MEHEFKIYYKNNGRYFVGISCSEFVRKITAQDFKRVLELKNIKDEKIKKVCVDKRVNSRNQLTLF